MKSRLDSFLAQLEETATPFFSQIQRTRDQNKPAFDDIGEFAIKLAEIQLGDGYLDHLIEGYCAFVLDVNRSQLEYEATRRYRHSSFNEVFAEVYDDPEFMSLYHWGVFVTTFAWEHHLKIAEFYRKDFLPLFTDVELPTLLDLGCGSGIWHLLAHREIPGLSSTGIDISKTSVMMAETLAMKLSLSDRAKYMVTDAMTFQADSPFTAGVSCFLLEHLEEPQKLLHGLSNALQDGAYAFVTCALTAAEIDHIFEIKHEHEIARMVYDAGFRLMKLLSASPTHFPKDRHYLARSVAMILQKRHNEIW